MTEMTEWRTMETKPEGVFDVLARYYDAGLNRFLIQRFCQCIINDLTVIWPSPFPGDKHTVDLMANGYRPIRWRPSPELPEDLREIPSGPDDHPRATPLPGRGR